MPSKVLISVIIVPLLIVCFLFVNRPVDDYFYVGVPLQGKDDFLRGFLYEYYGIQYVSVWQGNKDWKVCGGRFYDSVVNSFKFENYGFFGQGDVYYILDVSTSGYSAYLKNSADELIYIRRYPPLLGGENVSLTDELLCEEYTPGELEGWNRLETIDFYINNTLKS